jgi:hypothetical protein
MIEPLDPRTVRRVFTRGALVSVACADVPSEPYGVQVAALLETWSGRRCRITMGRSRQVALPAIGSRIEIVASRPDGIHRIPAVVEELVIQGPPDDPRGPCLLTVRPDPRCAVREQARGFYRLSGAWRALVAVGLPGTPGERFFPAHVRSLSGAGFLIEDPTGLLSEGLRFRVALSCADGELPIEAQAEVVRRDRRAGEVSHRWGCCFHDLAPDLEARIVRALHRRIRDRLQACRVPARDESIPQTS